MPYDGVLVVDKPAGISSARVVATVKRTLKARKVGHAGTLDPDATGVLVCCVNAATRLARFFLAGAKTYRATLRLGVDTTTQDAAGEVVARRPVAADAAAVRAASGRFEGVLEQVPPAYSALKHQGVPLYRLARSGRPVVKPPRRVTVYRLVIERVALPWVDFEVTCSAGTYVRTLCADWGEALGCGGHLAALQRIASGGFTLAEAVTLDALAERAAQGRAQTALIGMADALRGMPEAVAETELAERIGDGRPLSERDLAPPAAGTQMKIVDHDRRLLAVVRYETDTRRYAYDCVMPTQPNVQHRRKKASGLVDGR